MHAAEEHEKDGALDVLMAEDAGAIERASFSYTLVSAFILSSTWYRAGAQ